jgi:hypothetical protein
VCSGGGRGHTVHGLVHICTNMLHNAGKAVRSARLPHVKATAPEPLRTTARAVCATARPGATRDERPSWGPGPCGRRPAMRPALTHCREPAAATSFY